MTTAGQVTLQISLAVLLVIIIAYAAGRVHQWYRRSVEQDEAYREGYNQASLTLFPLAVRKPGAMPPSLAGRHLDDYDTEVQNGWSYR